MMDSSASIMLQLVDVLLGAVTDHFKIPLLTAADADKRGVTDRLAAAYNVPTLGAGPDENGGACYPLHEDGALFVRSRILALGDRMIIQSYTRGNEPVIDIISMRFNTRVYPGEFDP